jgi:hypothetical protein
MNGNSNIWNRVLIWHFSLVLIKINYGQIGDQTGLFYTTNPVFYTSGNRFVCRTGTLMIAKYWWLLHSFVVRPFLLISLLIYIHVYIPTSKKMVIIGQATLILSMSLNFIWRNDKWYNKRVLIWHFSLVLIKINYGQIGDQTKRSTKIFISLWI